MSAKSVIELWLWGGPSQLETFDPKPDASPDYNNGLKAIDTVVPGMKVHEWWPNLAKCANLCSFIRSMTHPHFGHETATYLMQTGRNPGGGTVYPAIGAVMALMRAKTYSGDLPPYVILTNAKGRFSEVGFLGDKYAPLVTGGNPNQPKFVVDGIVPPGGLTKEEIKGRFDLLSSIDTFGRPEAFTDFIAAGKEARRVIEGSAAATFDLSQETDAMRDRYGRTWIGQSLLAARRLVEYGVPYITVNMSGWDSHKRHFETMKQRTADTDKAIAALKAEAARLDDPLGQRRVRTHHEVRPQPAVERRTQPLPALFLGARGRRRLPRRLRGGRERRYGLEGGEASRDAGGFPRLHLRAVRHRPRRANAEQRRQEAHRAAARVDGRPPQGNLRLRASA